MNRNAMRKCSGSSALCTWYYVHLWESSEAGNKRVCWFITAGRKPSDISQDESHLYRYFKTKFRNHIHDHSSTKAKNAASIVNAMRKSVPHQSQTGKRELAQMIQSLFEIRWQPTLQGEPREQLRLYHRLLGDERFKGRKDYYRGQNI